MLKHTGNVIKVFKLSQGDISAGKAELLKSESLNAVTESTVLSSDRGAHARATYSSKNKQNYIYITIKSQLSVSVLGFEPIVLCMLG